MHYNKTIILKDGRECLLRHGVKADGHAALEQFRRAHEETDFLLTYTDEITFTPEEEGDFLQKKADSDNEIEILAVIDGRIVGTAGIEQLSPRAKLRHRCDFGISIDRACWGLGIGRALTEACIECAKTAGYDQIELEVVAENVRAYEMYRRAGYIEYGRNPRSFKSRLSGYQEIIYMRMELT
jgi:ribosomal protein S18 acetylase RimI-like enzyme